MMIRQAFILAVFLTLATLRQAYAAEESPLPAPFPDVLQGVWSSPDCARSDTILILSRSFSVRVEQNPQPLPGDPMESMHISPIRNWRVEGDGDEKLYYYRLSNRESYILKITNDGLMESNYALIHPQQPLYTAWGSTQDLDASEFAHCTKLFDVRPSITEEEIKIPFLMDQAMDACAAVKPDDFPLASNCHAALFAIADSNKDHVLDATELARVYKQIGLLSLSLNSCGSTMPHYPGPIPMEAAEFSTQALGKLDQDGSGDLSEREVLSGLSNPLFMQGRLYQFVERARGVRSMLPFLQLSDGEKVCLSDPAPDEQEWTGQLFPAPKPAASPLYSGSCSSCAAAAPVNP
ncbi:MAG TPA: hypothetical protein VIF12_06235 [Micavibrio sp.]|jgi:hypothetical protein